MDKALTFPENEPVAYACSSGSGLEDLLDSARKLSRGDEFVLLLKDDEAIARRVLPAYLNAYIRHKEGHARSESLQMETLLFIAGTFKIGDAIRMCGVRDTGSFLLVCSGRELARRYARTNKVKIGKEHRLVMDSSFTPVIE